MGKMFVFKFIIGYGVSFTICKLAICFYHVNQLFFAFCKFTSLYIFCKSTVCLQFFFHVNLMFCFTFYRWRRNCLHFVSLLFLLCFGSTCIRTFFISEGNNFKTLAQELGQVEFSYLRTGESLSMQMPSQKFQGWGDNFPPLTQVLFFDYNDTTHNWMTTITKK